MYYFWAERFCVFLFLIERNWQLCWGISQRDEGKFINSAIALFFLFFKLVFVFIISISIVWSHLRNSFFFTAYCFFAVKLYLSIPDWKVFSFPNTVILWIVWQCTGSRITQGSVFNTASYVEDIKKTDTFLQGFLNTQNESQIFQTKVMELTALNLMIIDWN